MAGPTGPTLKPALTPVHPALTTEEAITIKPKMRPISQWTTYFPITEKNGFGANIWLPALTIDGYVVGPREEFSFWKAVGPVSRAKGYKQGGAIINGRTEPQGALGRRDLLVLDDPVQRRAPGRLRDGRPAEPLLLHRPLPDRAGRDRVPERIRARSRT